MNQDNAPAPQTAFLRQVAAKLLSAWGIEGFRNAAVYFPTTRARLFFTQHLSELLDAKDHSRPFWMPSWGNTSELFQEMAGMQIVEPMMLIPHLHRIFLTHYKRNPSPTTTTSSRIEDLNEFYYWGETLLHDFSQVDLYLCDAQRLFANIDALKTIDDAFDYLTEEQKKVLHELFDFEERKKGINRFFSILKEEGNPRQELKQQFLSIWRILWPVYSDMRQFMHDNRIGYSAHVARRAIELLQKNLIEESTLERLFPPRIAFAGFNALNRCEQVLFDFIETRYGQRQESALFFWNYSESMLEDPINEAGLFMRRHKAAHRIDRELSPAAKESQGAWQLHAAPSTLAQVSILSRTMQDQLAFEGNDISSRTAIVLADENLLLPLLRTLPQAIERCNVTMGYPLQNTLTFSVLKSYLSLLASHDASTFTYARAALIDFLSHPYLAPFEHVGALRAMVRDAQNDRIVPTQFNGCTLPDLLFPACGIENPISSSQRLLRSIADALSSNSQDASESATDSPTQQLDADNLLSAFAILDTLRASLNRAEYPYSADEKRGIQPCDAARAVLLLLPKLFRNAKTDFFGEPLEGLQVMGFLETRALDFDTIYILSANDDFLPRVSTMPSFIPYSLQRAFGLPTRSDHEAMYAYYFDTITMRAKRVVLIYTIGGESTDPSRYILQRKYAPSTPTIEEKRNSLPSPTIFSSQNVTISKTPEILATLSQYLAKDGASTSKELSPSSLKQYIKCPLSFYYKHIARIAPPDADPKENFKEHSFGTCVHTALEKLYAPLVNTTLTAATLEKLANPDTIKDAIRHAFAKEIGFPSPDTPIASLPLRWTIYLRSAQRYVENVIKVDRLRLDRVESILGLEYAIHGKLVFTDEQGGEQRVRVGGTIDRLDRLRGGSGFEIVDYKTGTFNRDSAIFVGAENLTAATQRDHGNQLQILLYALLLGQQPGFGSSPITAGLWFPRCRDDNFKLPGLFHGEGKPFDSADYESTIGALPGIIGPTLASLFDGKVPFTQRDNDRICSHCDYRLLCNR